MSVKDLEQIINEAVAALATLSAIVPVPPPAIYGYIYEYVVKE